MAGVMIASNQNQPSADQNVAGENVPMTTVNTTRLAANDKQNTSKGGNTSSNAGDRNGDTEKNTGDGTIDNTYNPEDALIKNPVLAEVPEGFNLYRNKKTLTQGLMDIALFSANANQLRYILEHGATNKAFFYIAASLIIFSLILQIGVGLLLLISTQYNVSVACQRQMAYRYGNYVVIGIFLITVVNVFIAAFGGPAVTFPPAAAATPSANLINNSTSVT